jgi:hypothetical protein
MKISLCENSLEIETQNQQDFYMLGRIAAKFKKQASNYPGGQKTVVLEMAEVLKELAE